MPLQLSPSTIKLQTAIAENSLENAKEAILENAVIDTMIDMNINPSIGAKTSIHTKTPLILWVIKLGKDADNSILKLLLDKGAKIFFGQQNPTYGWVLPKLIEQGNIEGFKAVIGAHLKQKVGSFKTWITPQLLAKTLQSNKKAFVLHLLEIPDIINDQEKSGYWGSLQLTQLVPMKKGQTVEDFKRIVEQTPDNELYFLAKAPIPSQQGKFLGGQKRKNSSTSNGPHDKKQKIQERTI